jgi:hypothetical protein
LTVGAVLPLLVSSGPPESGSLKPATAPSNQHNAARTISPPSGPWLGDLVGDMQPVGDELDVVFLRLTTIPILPHNYIFGEAVLSVG